MDKNCYPCDNIDTKTIVYVNSFHQSPVKSVTSLQLGLAKSMFMHANH